MEASLTDTSPSLPADQLLDFLPWGLLAFDEAGAVCRLNRRAAACWGLAEADALGRSLAELPAGLLPAGMYRLFEAKPGTAVQPDIYLDFALDADQPAAERVVAAPDDICRTLRGLQQPRWQCLTHLDDAPPIAQPLQVATGRLTQELTQNVLKHARARHATLEVETLPGWLVLRAEDDGAGFDPAVPSLGLGLRTLRDRVALLGGDADLLGAPDQGTQVRVRIPL